ncbi:YgjV family protein [Clostridium senegalense]|uniref:YgjV family protein n=1 Tax=Clostridium senegalense TaxID=1465809 RepID=A0A6M0H4E0_9CLOT|nr:YgjV family protein [Clostridium senegalense]NEU05387.1 YgjV family protein [Clostridium senegalense]
MLGIPMIEWVGYAASLFIAISLLMTSIIKLRIFNTIGCILFVVYGFVIRAYPVIVTNGAIILINFWNLYRIYLDNKDLE